MTRPLRKHCSMLLATLLLLTLIANCAGCSSEPLVTPDDTTAGSDTTPAPDTDTPETDAPNTTDPAETEPVDDRPENIKTIYVTSGAAEDGAD